MQGLAQKHGVRQKGLALTLRGRMQGLVRMCNGGQWGLTRESGSRMQSLVRMLRDRMHSPMAAVSSAWPRCGA